MRRERITILAVILIIFPCIWIPFYSLSAEYGTPSRGDELWSISFPKARTGNDGTPYVELDSGSRAFITFQLKNDLASDQEFRIMLENASGWTIKLPTHSNEMRMSVASGGLNTSTIVVDAPTSGEIEIVVNASVSTKFILQPLRLISLPASLTVIPETGVLLADAGEELNTNITVRNNLPEDDDVVLSISSSVTEGDSAMEEEWVGKLSSGAITVPGNDSRRVILTVFAPIKVTANNMVVVEVFAHSSNRDKAYSTKIDYRIRTHVGLDLQPRQSSLSANPGDEVEFNIAAGNSGNDDMMITAQIIDHPAGWKVRIIPMSAYVEMGAQKDFTVHVETLEDSLAGGETIGINFSSGGHFEIVPLTLHVKAVTSFEIVRSFYSSNYLYPGEGVHSNFVVHSGCNHYQKLTLGIENLTDNLKGYFTVLDTVLSGENATEDLSTDLNMSNRKGQVHRSPGQEVAEIDIVLAPFQEIIVRAEFLLLGLPPLGVNAINAKIKGTMSSLHLMVDNDFELRAARLSISNMEVDGKVLDDDGLVELTKGERHSVTVTVENELDTEATDVTVSLVVEGSDETAVSTISRIGPKGTADVKLSWTSRRSPLDEEELVTISVKDSGGAEASRDWVKVSLVASEEDTSISLKYVVISAVLLVFLIVFIIVVIRAVKKDREKKARKAKEDAVEGEEDDFFSSERSTYYGEADYESMGTSGGAITAEELYGTGGTGKGEVNRKGSGKGRGKRKEKGGEGDRRSRKDRRGRGTSRKRSG